MIERTPDGHVYAGFIQDPPYASALVTRDAWHTVTRPGPRRGLRESLEAYAARIGMRVHDARPFWRAEALRLLNVAVPFDPFSELHLLGLCACAPGVAVPTAFVDWPDDYPPLPFYAATRRP